MLIIPAIDLRGGNCVMLFQGRLENETIYSKDPVFIAKLWQAKGAKRLHIVDLDGAFQGAPQNLEILKNIRQSVDIPIQFGGGVRSLKTISNLFEIGIDYVILGTVIIYNPEVAKQSIEKYKDKIIIAIDARDSKVAIGGWKETTTFDAVDIAKKVKSMGVSQIIYTDINKDGTLQGPEINNIKEFAQKIDMNIIVSGGISSISDIKNLLELKKYGISGVIIGKALYSENIKLEEALKIVNV